MIKNLTGRPFTLVVNDQKKTFEPSYPKAFVRFHGSSKIGEFDGVTIRQESDETPIIGNLPERQKGVLLVVPSIVYDNVPFDRTDVVRLGTRSKEGKIREGRELIITSLVCFHDEGLSLS